VPDPTKYRRVNLWPHVAVRRAEPFTGAAPFAVGGIDVRSRALAQTMGLCGEAWAFVQEAWAGGHEACPLSVGRHGPCSHDSWSVAGDGYQGLLAAMCNDWRRHNITAHHLTWSKFESNIQRGGPNLHASVMHGYKDYKVETQGKDLPRAWVWNMGEAMLPLEYTLYQTEAGGIGWEPRDIRQALEFKRVFKQHGEVADRLSLKTVPSCAKLRALNVSLECTAVTDW
jgi:hypothetical protein